MEHDGRSMVVFWETKCLHNALANPGPVCIGICILILQDGSGFGPSHNRHYMVMHTNIHANISCWYPQFCHHWDGWRIKLQEPLYFIGKTMEKLADFPLNQSIDTTVKSHLAENITATSRPGFSFGLLEGICIWWCCITIDNCQFIDDQHHDLPAKKWGQVPVRKVLNECFL